MNDSVLVLTLAGAITAGTPIVLAGLGELLSERAGILNLSVEGTMLLGAIGTFTAIQATDNVIVGVAVGILWGALIGSLHAVLSVSFRANQILSGLACSFSLREWRVSSGSRMALLSLTRQLPRSRFRC